MTYSLIWLADVLRAAGLTVVERPGWKTRGLGDVGKIHGVMCHHTAASRKGGNAPSLKICTEGRKGPNPLRGPLSQLVLARDGTWYVIAAGKCQHAGVGSWGGIKNCGNAHFIGIEAENSGLADDHPWPPVQMDSYARGCAAMLRHLGLPAERCIGHLEYAPGRKSDPSFSIGTREQRVRAMGEFRSRVGLAMRRLSGAAPLLGEIPPDVRPPADGPGDGDDWPEDLGDLRMPPAAIEHIDVAPAAPDRDTIERVQAALRRLNYFGVGKVDGDMAAMTRGAIVAFKHEHGLAPETPEITEAFLARLATAAPRQVSDARANATAADVAASVPTVNETWWSRTWAKVLTIPAAIATAVGMVREAVRPVREALEPVTSMLGHVPWFVWCAGALGVGVLIWRSQRHAEQSAVDLYRQGRVL